MNATHNWFQLSMKILFSSLPLHTAFDLVFQRKSPMFKAIVVTPAIVIVFMTLVSFWLPPQAGFEKLLLNGVVVICILLVFFSSLLPVLSSSTPLIGKTKIPRFYIYIFTVLWVHSCVKLIKFPRRSCYSYVLPPHAISAVHFVHNICHCHQHVS